MIELDLNISIVEIRLCEKNRYGCQPFDQINKWICFKPEVEEWMETNMKRKSGIKVKYTGGYSLIRFENENDALLFKMRWL